MTAITTMGEAEDQDGEQDGDETVVEPSNLAAESRFRPVAFGDFDFDEDAMLPMSNYGNESLRVASERRGANSARWDVRGESSRTSQSRGEFFPRQPRRAVPIGQGSE